VTKVLLMRQHITCYVYIIPKARIRKKVYKYNETSVLHFSCNLLRIKSLYMFRGLLAHPQEALHKRHLVYCVRMMSVGCAKIADSLQPWHSRLTLYALNIPSAICVALPEDKQVMLETCRGH
jgi:hypothetical protein